MKQITLWPWIRQHSWRRGGQGFSLVELLVAAVAGLFVIAVAGDADLDMLFIPEAWAAFLFRANRVRHGNGLEKRHDECLYSL